MSAECRDPNYPWDKPEWATNYKETLSPDEQLMDFYHYDISKKNRFSIPTAFGQFFFAVGLAFGLLYVSSQFKMFLPLFPRQYPHDEPHYTFEMEEKGKKAKPKPKKTT